MDQLTFLSAEPPASFSVAGLRGGLADDRGNLALEYLRLADRARPRWLVWENVPGVLSSNGGRDFGAILGGMVELGYGVAYRVLDAQFFGVPQRRRRVFVVGHLGDWRRAAAVLFERHGLSGNPSPRRETGQGTPGFTPSGFAGYREGVGTLRSEGGDYGGGTETLIAFDGQNLAECGDLSATLDSGAAHGNRGMHVAHALRAEGFDASEDGTGRGTPLVVGSLGTRSAGHTSGLKHESDFVVPVAFAQNSRDELREMPYAGALAAEPGMKQQSYIRQASAVRRLTPRECERLQGFPDDYTLVPHRGRMMADGPRYKCLGNSMAVPVVRWIGERIEAVEAIAEQRAAA